MASSRLNGLSGVGTLASDFSDPYRERDQLQRARIMAGAERAGGEMFRVGGAGGAARRSAALLQGLAGAETASSDLFDQYQARDLQAQGLRLEDSRAAEQARQFDRGYMLDQQQFREGRRQFDESMGFDRERFMSDADYRDRALAQEGSLTRRQLALQRAGLDLERAGLDANTEANLRDDRQRFLEALFGQLNQSGYSGAGSDEFEYILGLMEGFI